MEHHSLLYFSSVSIGQVTVGLDHRFTLHSSKGRCMLCFWPWKNHFIAQGHLILRGSCNRTEPAWSRVTWTESSLFLNQTQRVMFAVYQEKSGSFYFLGCFFFLVFVCFPSWWERVIRREDIGHSFTDSLIVQIFLPPSLPTSGVSSIAASSEFPSTWHTNLLALQSQIRLHGSALASNCRYTCQNGVYMCTELQLIVCKFTADVLVRVLSCH